MLFPLTTMRAFVQKIPHGVPQYQGVSETNRRTPRLSARDAKRRSGNVAEIGLMLHLLLMGEQDSVAPEQAGFPMA
jgi:hypothetical protein